jgi:hypothetical protein
MAGLFFHKQILIQLIIMKGNSMFEKKHVVFKSPDLNELQVVVIDHRTKIYIPIGADAEEARSRYFARIATKK